MEFGRPSRGDYRSGEKGFCAGSDLKRRTEKEKAEILLEREKSSRPSSFSSELFPSACEAEETHRLGIHNQLVPGDELMEQALETAGQITGNPVSRVRQAKKALDLGADISRALDFDFEASKACFFSEDALKGPEKS
ncbi:MAG: hypothetical protein P8182_18305 [Deltaproteobacteria bacterium]